MNKAVKGVQRQDGGQGLFNPGVFNPAWLLGFAASLLLAVAVWGAAWQPVHVNAFRMPTLFDPLLYPQEDNAWQRLPKINSALGDVFALDDGEHVWVVGAAGLILYSDDGGRHWQRGKVQMPALVPASQSSAFDFFASAWAGGPPVGNDGYQAAQQQAIPAANNAPAANSAANVKSAGDDVSSGKPPEDSSQPTPAQPKTPEAEDFDKWLSAVYFTDAQHGWAVGENGTILASTDGGNSWQLQTSGTDQYLASVQFAADARHGWAVGGKGTILASADGGNSWQPQTSGTDQGLGCVQFAADARHGWAVGDKGTILASADGGQSWQPRASGTDQYIHEIRFAADYRQGWAVGNGGTILASEDGGQSWQPQTSGTGQDLDSVQFAADARHGFAVGEKGTILASADGGRSWQPQTSGTKQDLYNIKFSDDALTGWAVGEEGTILASDDGGQNWQPRASGFQQRLFRSHYTADTSHGWVVGLGGTILTSEDGGNSWQPQPSGTKQGLIDVHFAADASHGWAVGEKGTILASDDGGRSWQPQTSSTKQSLIDVHFAADASHGWAVGEKGTILASADGGDSWQPQTSGTNQDLASVQFAADARHGWAVGEEGTILASNDGGQSWQPHGGTEQDLVSIHFVADSRHGWAVGDGGTILTSNDDGQNWQPQRTGTKQDLYGIHFAADNRHGWVVGDGGTILVSEDGGQSWQPQPSGTNQFLISIHFATDALKGWAMGDRGTILGSGDGGKSWQPVRYQRYPAGWVYLALLLAIALGFWAYLLARRRDKSHQPVSGVMNRGLTDNPAGGPDGGADLLGARLLAAGLVRFLSNHYTSPPLTLAITGEWGSGKSSVMNYLFTGLRRNGLKPVMFNAWHHRDEQNVLASIFTSLHKQIIGPWWSWGGLWFRARLLWKRNLLAKLALAGAAGSLLFCALWFNQHRAAIASTGEYAAYQIGILEPVLLGQAGYESLCPTAKPLASEIKSTTETTLFKPDQATAIPSSETKIERIARQESKLDASKAVFDETQCQKLKAGLLGKTPADLSSCLNGEGAKRCFERPQKLIGAVEASLGQHLTVEEETRLLTAVEHLHPDFPLPLPLPPALLQWLSALAALLSFLMFKGLALVGLAPAKLMQGAMTLAGSAPRLGEPVGTRVLFEQHFKRVTEVLGRRRLVLFIDDLDRCDPEHCRQVLEITNFLASAGGLYVVLGMAPRYVLANVALCFEQVAAAVDEVDKLNGVDNHHHPDIGESWFARHFLQKLIHIEVPVPTPEAAQVLALLRGERQQGENDAEELRLEKLENAEKMLARIWQWLKRAFSVLLLLIGMGLGAGLGSGWWQPWVETKPTIEQSAQSVAATPGPVVKPPQPPEPDPTQKPDARGASFTVGQESASHWQRLWPLGLLMVALGLVLWLARQPKILDIPSLSWLQPLVQRLKIWLFGPETSADSDAFDQALKIWYPVIALANPIPRNVKGFLNQLRYFASREYPQGCKNRDEAQLVAMAVAYYAFAEQMDKVFKVAKLNEGQAWVFADSVFAQHLKDNGMMAAVLQAVEEHYSRFGEFPSQTERERFKRYQAMISIQRRDPK